MNIVFVCTGNTCRSPLAEGLFKAKLNKSGFTGIEVISAGLAAYPGDEVSQNSVQAAQSYGIDISAHRARRISEYMLDSSIFVCMSHSHLAALAPYVNTDKLFLLGNGIDDPYGGSREVYNSCATQIDAALESFLNMLIKQFLSVSPMVQEHIKQISEIEKLCFSVPWSEKSLEEELANENAHFLAATFGGRVLGYIGVIEICGEADITNVAVHPDFRRIGLGDKLLKAAENAALTRSCQSITLEVRASNTAAISLYNKNGYHTVGIRKGFYEKPKEDALLMTKFFNKEEKL